MAMANIFQKQKILSMCVSEDIAKRSLSELCTNDLPASQNKQRELSLCEQRACREKSDQTRCNKRARMAFTYTRAHYPN